MVNAAGAQATLVPVDVVIDSREHSQNPVFKDMLAKRGLRVVVMKLEEGDFYVNGKATSAVVERKTWDDLASSLAEGRLWSQAQRLRELGVERGLGVYLVVEGDPRDVIVLRDISFNSLLSSLERLQTSYGLTVLYVPDKEVVADWLAYLSRRLREHDARSANTFTTVIQKPPRKRTVDDRIRALAYVLAGPTIGERLLRRFRSLRDLANASVAELMSVEGVGERRARMIYEVFNKPYRASLEAEESRR